MRGAGELGFEAAWGGLSGAEDGEQRPLARGPWVGDTMGERQRKSESMTTLREIALRHGVRYEVSPEMNVVDHQIIKVGFDLKLWGLHAYPEGFMSGCRECERVYQDLRKIADWILPKDERPSRYEVEGFDSTLHEAPDFKDRDEVLLEVKILHRHDAFSPIDACEERCLKEMRENLAKLGVGEGTRRPRE